MSNLAVVDKNDSLETRKELIKSMYCKNCSDDEVKIFIHVCRNVGLDPFMRQIYAIKRGSVMTIQTAIDGLRLIAERTGNYAPGKETYFVYDDNKKLLSATSYIKKRTSDGTWHEIGATAYLDEYDAGQGLWKKMPRAMLSKCAEALALRKAFPDCMSGIYTKEEMDQAREEDVEELVEEKTKLSIGQIEEIEAACGDNRDLFNRILKAYKATTLLDIDSSEFDTIMRRLNLSKKELSYENTGT